uniref:Enoyl reductase (ER) domain-containing protein n=2 Tax=Arion vulgaris TaxID=1028688 RepID=A0A0B7AUB6_9EUPU
MGPPDWWQEYEARKESGGTSSNSDISSVIEVTTMYLGGKKDMTVSMTSSTTTAVTTPSTSVTTAAQEIYLSIENPLQRRQSSPSLVMKESAEEDDILLELATGLESSRILHKSASCKSADLDIQNLGDIRQSKKSHRSAWGRVKDIIHTRRDSIKKKPKRGKSGVDSEETSEIDVEAMLEEHWRSDVFDEGLTGRSTPKSSPMVIRQQSTKGTSDTSLGASTSLHKMSPSKGPIFHLGSSPANKDMVTLLDTTSSNCEVKRMQAVQHTPGGPDKLFIATVPLPEPNENEVRIKVYASAINRADTLQRRGLYPPLPGVTDVLGLEAAGVIDKVGPGCPKSITVGQRVCALLPGGGNAEYVTCRNEQVIQIPAGLTFLQAAAIPEVWLTAYQLLYFVGKLTKDDTVLIHAGGSGVGTAAVQLVKQAGATSIVTAGSQDKIDFAISLGAQAGINYKDGSFGEKVLKLTNDKGVNLILDCVGASMYDDNLKSLSVDGRWVNYGLLGGPLVNADLSKLLSKRVHLLFSTLRVRSVPYKASLVHDFAKLSSQLFANGTFQPVIYKVFQLSEIAQAHILMESNENLGKIVLKVRDDDSEEK